MTLPTSTRGSSLAILAFELRRCAELASSPTRSSPNRSSTRSADGGNTDPYAAALVALDVEHVELADQIAKNDRAFAGHSYCWSTLLIKSRTMTFRVAIAGKSISNAIKPLMLRSLTMKSM
jgi:hypothetical protein